MPADDWRGLKGGPEERDWERRVQRFSKKREKRHPGWRVEEKDG